MAETYTVGHIHRTMTDVDQENDELRQWLLVTYRQAMSDAAALRQMAEGKERSAQALARWLEKLGVDLDGNVLGM